MPAQVSESGKCSPTYNQSRLAAVSYWPGDSSHLTVRAPWRSNSALVSRLYLYGPRSPSEPSNSSTQTT